MFVFLMPLHWGEAQFNVSFVPNNIGTGKVISGSDTGKVITGSGGGKILKGC